MKNIAYRKKYLVKESVGATSLHESYVVIDPLENSTLAEVTEEATFGQKIAKLFVDKALLSAKLVMKSLDGDLLLEISQPASIFHPLFTVKNPDGHILCTFKQKFSLFQPRIVIEDGKGQSLGKIEGDWKLRNFQLKDNNQNVMATIRHQFSGLAKELLTSADDYEITMNSDASMSLIALAATVCIDFMFHES